jgi:VCBS repeat-containing protein
MARRNILSAFDALDPDTEALDPNLFSTSPILLDNASPTPPTEVQLPKAAAERLPDVALHNLPGFIIVPIVESAPTAAASTPPTQIAVESALTTSASLLAGDPLDPDPTDCPRSITFTLSGAPGVTIHAEEGVGDFAGDLVFTATVNNTATLEGDLGGLFFQFNESKLSGLTVTGDVPLSFQTDPTGGDKIIDLGGGVNMRGAGTTGFDLGILFATTSTHQDITTASFVISDPQHDLKLEDLHDPGESSQVGVRVISVGSPSGPRHASEKLTGFAPYPPTAVDDFYTTNEDDAITVDVTANDQDANANGFPLTVDHIVSQPTYGTVTINADGTLTYTPFLDAVIDGTAITTNQDTFQYCVHDALGGEDNATVTVTVIPEAEPPSISLSVVGVGASASDTLIRVTAISEDFGTRTQGSDFIQSLRLSVTGNFPDVITFSDDQHLLDPSTNTITTFGQPGTFTDVIHVNTSALIGQNINLDDVLTITAVAAETELPTATASASQSQPIQIDYSQFSATPDFQATGSIWTSGSAFTTDLTTFLGLGPRHFHDTIGGTTLGFGATLSGTLDLKAGFEADLHITSGDFSADIPFNVTLNATYNKTTDTLQIDETDSAGTGSISTHGPEGSLSLAFILDAMAAASGKVVAFGTTVLSLNTHVTTNNKATLVSFNSSQLSTSFSFGGVSLTFAWPNIDTSGTGTGGTITSVNTSNPIVNAQIDLIALLLAAFGLPPNLLNFDSIDILSLEAGLSASLKQQFDLSVLGLTPTLLVGTTQTPEPVDAPIQNVSSLGLANDGSVPISLRLTPTDPTLQNITSLAGSLGFDPTVLKFDDLPAIFSTHIDIPLGSLPLYKNTFPVAFQPQTEHFNVT